MKENPLPNTMEDVYDIANYMRLAFTLNKVVYPKVTKKEEYNLKDLQPCLAFLPLNKIEQTLACTTQLAKWHTRVPMQRHWQPRFPFLNVHRLSEPVSTDTVFSNTRALGGATCVQVFYGMQSHMINVYPMKKESEGSYAYEDFIREEGCPTILRRDNSKMQKGDDFITISRHYCVKDEWSEAYHQHQNPVEHSAVRWLKSHAQTVMNISGAPPQMWAECLKWISAIHNLTANEALQNRTPYEKRHGSTPDISAYILFTFWEKIYYLDTANTYPNSKELPGHFLGVAGNVGDALTFVILSDDGQILNRSVIRSASGKPLAGFPNLRLNHTQYEGTPPEPLPTLITLNAAPKTDTKHRSVQKADADIQGQDADIAVSNTDGPVNSSQDKGGIGAKVLLKPPQH